jgi:predicted amidohydrolase YtcJ
MKSIVKMGVTSITEAGLRTWKELEILQEMYKDNELLIRVNILLASRILDEAIAKSIKNNHGDEWIRITGVKLYADGWLTPRTAALIEPYENRLGKGILFYNSIKAEALVRKAYEADLRIATHAIGDRGILTMIDAYEKVLIQSEKDQFRNRVTIEHASVMRKDTNPENNLISRMNTNNIIASYQLGFAAIDNQMSLELLGEKRYQYCYAWRSLIDEGIKIAGGSDWPIDTVSPLYGIQRAVTRKDINNESAEICNPKEKITIEEALETLTINGAFNSFEEKIKGSIETGKLADLVVLSKDILKFTSNNTDDEYYVGNIHKIKVEMTIIDGKIVYEK